MNSLKRFSINLDNRYFRQTNSVVGHSRPVLSLYGHTGQDGNVCTLGIQHTSQIVVDASFLMDKRLVDQAAWTQNRAITTQEVTDYGDLREHIPANDSDRWMCGICDQPPIPERALWTEG
ncbi:hypothetical protein PMI29_05600 [Pseudomonas sp. GM49]|uniref:hypothetical protein n=1 Tax=Pseudomonas sp. GM49 TaxID=1144331 RepID=UPI00027006D5|nr:hypothetical protein [Pseudomonas sp. GM49]EJM54509.1 hypothetical protein PMI29_05600 [Pseudomonas sp. GM49]